MRFPKLDETKVEAIKELHNQGFSGNEIAKRLNISQSTVSIYAHIIKERTHKGPIEKKSKFKLKIIEATTP